MPKPERSEREQRLGMERGEKIPFVGKKLMDKEK
jgi:hypothetical protein